MNTNTMTQLTQASFVNELKQTGFTANNGYFDFYKDLYRFTCLHSGLIIAYNLSECTYSVTGIYRATGNTVKEALSNLELKSLTLEMFRSMGYSDHRLGDLLDTPLLIN